MFPIYYVKMNFKINFNIGISHFLSHGNRYLFHDVEHFEENLQQLNLADQKLVRCDDSKEMLTVENCQVFL